MDYRNGLGYAIGLENSDAVSQGGVQIVPFLMRHIRDQKSVVVAIYNQGLQEKRKT